MVRLVSRIINYTKKSLKSHDLSDFFIWGVFLQPRKKVIQECINPIAAGDF